MLRHITLLNRAVKYIDDRGTVKILNILSCLSLYFNEKDKVCSQAGHNGHEEIKIIM